MLDQGFTPQESYINGLIDKKIATLISDVNTLKNSALLIDSVGTNWIKLQNGYMFVWGHTKTGVVTTLPDGIKFVDTDYAILGQYTKYDGCWESCCSGTKTQNSFKLQLGGKSDKMDADYIAFGKWK